MASTDATAIPIKGQAYRVTFPIWKTDGTFITGAAGLDSEVSKDGGTFADCTNEATEIATSSGIYYLDLTSTEMNADTVAIIVKSSTTGAITTVITLYPAEAADIKVNVVDWNGATAPAMTGDAYARLGAPAGASHAADVAAVKTDTAAIKTKTDSLTFTVAGMADANVVDWKGATAPAMTGDAFARLGAPAGASVSADVAAVKTDTGNLISRLGAFTGTGVNTVLGFLKAALSKAATLPSDVGGTFDPSTDSNEAIRDNMGTAQTGDSYARLGAPSGASVSADIALIGSYIDTEVAAIKAKTDALPASPAATSDIPTSDITAIKAKTDSLAFTVAGKVDSNPLALNGSSAAAAALAALLGLGITGTAQAGASQTITLATSASATLDAYKGWKIVTTGGTGAGQERIITGYSTGRVATVDWAWATNPDSTTTYVAAPIAAINIRTLHEQSLNDAVYGVLPADIQSISGSTTAASNMYADYLLGTAGSVQGGSSTTVTLQSFASTVDDFYKGWEVIIKTGTGNSQRRRIVGYVGSTRVATVAPAFDTAPASGGSYSVINTSYSMDVEMWKNAVAPAMTGDAYARLGAPAGASVSADIAAVKTDTAAIKTQTDKMNFTGTDIKATLDGETVALTDGSLTAAKFATDAIDANAIKADAVTEIQSGLATASALSTAQSGISSISSDTGTLLSRLSAARAGYLDTLNGLVAAIWAAVADSSGVTTPFSKLTSSRAGYLDNLNVSGPVASQADITALNLSSTRHVVLSSSPQYERPESGSIFYDIELRTYDSDGGVIDPDSDPTLAVNGITTGDLSANLSTLTHVSTGVYRWTYEVVAAAVSEQLRFDAIATIDGIDFSVSFFSQVVDLVAITWTSTDASNLSAIFDKLPSSDYIAGSENSDGSNDDIAAIKTKTDSLPADPADASDVADAIAAVQTHGDANWATATGFSTFDAGSDPVTVGTNNDKTGYFLDNDPPTASEIAAAVLDPAISGHLGAGTVGEAIYIGATRDVANSGDVGDIEAAISNLHDFDPTTDTVAHVTLVDTTADVTNPVNLHEGDLEDAIWDAVMADHLNPGSTGASLNGAGAAGDPWTAPLPGGYGAGTAGAIVGNNLDKAISDLHDFDPANDNVAHVTLVDTTTDLTNGAGLDEAAIRTALGMQNPDLDDQLDAIGTEISQLHDVSASEVASAITAGITPVQDVTDKLGTMIETHASYERFKVTALEESPAGGGGGGGGDPWVTDLPGAYPEGSAGFTLGNLLSNLISSISGHEVTVISPILANGEMQIVVGDDYFESDGRAFSWHITNLPVGDIDTVYLKIYGSEEIEGTFDGTDLVSFDIPRDFTSDLAPGKKNFHVELALANGHRVSPILGTADIKEV